MMMVYTAPAVAVSERGFVVTPSAHLLNTKREFPVPCGEITVTAHDAAVVHASVDGLVYEPDGQFVPETLNCVAVFASIRTFTVSAEKLAETNFGLSIIRLSGFAEPVAAPLHPVKFEPLCAVAVSCTVEPAA
jgi:hypothetical protein